MCLPDWEWGEFTGRERGDVACWVGTGVDKSSHLFRVVCFFVGGLAWAVWGISSLWCQKVIDQWSWLVHTSVLEKPVTNHPQVVILESFPKKTNNLNTLLFKEFMSGCVQVLTDFNFNIILFIYFFTYGNRRAVALSTTEWDSCGWGCKKWNLLEKVKAAYWWAFMSSWKALSSALCVLIINNAFLT
jgi:hypothetical protein